MCHHYKTFKSRKGIVAWLSMHPSHWPGIGMLSSSTRIIEVKLTEQYCSGFESAALLTVIIVEVLGEEAVQFLSVFWWVEQRADTEENASFLLLLQKDLSWILTKHHRTIHISSFFNSIYLCGIKVDPDSLFVLDWVIT